MSKYRVAQVKPPKYNNEDDTPEPHDEWAQELKDEYGLDHLSTQEVRMIWERYSDDMCAGWLIPNKGSVEDAFRVILEEINEIR